MSLPTTLRRTLLRVRDRLRFHPVAKAAAARWHSLRATRNAARAPLAALESWSAAARLAASDAEMQAIERQASTMLDGLSDSALWALAPARREEVTVKKVAILKPWTGGAEKGVMIVSFESQWVHLLALGKERLAQLLTQYQLVLAPTWSPPHHAVNFLFPRLANAPIYTTISNERDLEILPRLHRSYRPVPLYASSWVDADLYHPRPAVERDIDLVMVANFGTYKRHHVLFRALAKGGAPGLRRIVLIGQPQDARTAEVLLGEADFYGVRNRFELKSRISDAELVDCLCRAKASFIASLREGSCVAVVEAMMAGAPMALLKGAAIGSAAFLNEHTGAWLDEADLAQQLDAFVARYAQYRSREWLLENGIECRGSTRRLNSVLADDARNAGAPWTSEVAVHHWRPDPLLLEESAVPAARAEADRLWTELKLRLVSPQLLSATA